MKEFSIAEIEKIFEQHYKKSDICRCLEIPLNISGAEMTKRILYYSSQIGLSDKKDISSKSLHDRYFTKRKSDYYQNPKICPVCGNVIPYEKRLGMTCSSSCGTSIGNIKKGKRSESTKKRISESLKSSFYENRDKNRDLSKNGYTKISDLIEIGSILNNENYEYFNTYKKVSSLKYRKCPICGKMFCGRVLKSGRIGYGSTCSESCLTKLRSIKSKETISKIMDEGRFQGWQSRNIISYAEKFWKAVLDNNKISYIREFHLDKKYFLDFFIEKNGVKIDLEIDGKQHSYPDRMEHDKIRDEYIRSKGLVVYRIPWNEISSNDGSLEMKRKIDDFLEFYNSL